ncbi:MAG: response regulator [Desulfovibrio sp.]
MKPIRVILVDDHELVREGVRFFLSGLPSIAVVGIAATPAEAFQIISRASPDAAMVDLGLPTVETGIGLIEDIKSRYPRIKVLAFTCHEDAHAIRGALAAGADGYLLKSASIPELSSAIENVVRGKTYLSPDVSANVVCGYLGQNNQLDTTENNLSRREKEVLRLLLEGKGNKEIGRILYISHRTVEKHKANVKTKLNCDTTVELAVYCMKNGILQ